MRGDCFGEDALLSNSPRNATVKMMQEGRLMRLADSYGVDRADFLQHYQGYELDPNWTRRVSRLGKAWNTFATRHRDDIAAIRKDVAATTEIARLPVGEFRRIGKQ